MYALKHGVRFTRRTGASAHRRIGASVLFALVACLSQADLHLVIPSDGPLPLYFSSTNSRISARAWISGNSDGIESFKLKLNGFPVYGKTFDPQQGELPSSWRAHVMFDSTHWGKEMTDCVVRLEAKEVGKPEQSKEVTVPIKNRAAGYILHDFVATGDSLSPTMARLGEMGYVNQAEVSQQGWTAAQCHLDIAGCTVFYVASHGHYIQEGVSYFVDGTAHLEENPNTDVKLHSLGFPGSSFPVKPVREAAVGTNLQPEQLPPFNPTGNPPIAFAWVDSCNTGIGSEFLPAFCYPEKNKFAPEQIEDQAEMGWLWRVENHVLDEVATLFWGEVAKGRDLEYCRAAAQAKYYELAGYEPGGPNALRLFGDPFTRLKDVYTGDNSYVPSQGQDRRWFRVLLEGSGQ